MLRIRPILLLALLAGGCAAPEEPAALKNSSESPSSSQKKDHADAGSVNFGGAQVGDESLQNDVRACVRAGSFFDRITNKCMKDLRLAKISCTEQEITKYMRPSDQAKYAEIRGKELGGFALDQCLDCSSPVDNPFCEGQTATKETLKGIRLFHVLVQGNKVVTRSVYIYDK
jgi:hypothetical protein